MEDLQYMLEDFNADVILEALKEAVNQGKANLPILKSILNRWKQDNLMTVELVREHKAIREAKKRPTLTQSQKSMKNGASRADENPF